MLRCVVLCCDAVRRGGDLWRDTMRGGALCCVVWFRVALCCVVLWCGWRVALRCVVVCCVVMRRVVLCCVVVCSGAPRVVLRDGTARCEVAHCIV